MLDLNQLPTPDIAIHEFVLLIFLFITALYAIFSGVLYYHWKEYATDEQVTIFTLATYFATTLPLIIAMGVLALIIN
jgi:hypothetical protein